jgi:hypothetical protein
MGSDAGTTDEYLCMYKTDYSTAAICKVHVARAIKRLTFNGWVESPSKAFIDVFCVGGTFPSMLKIGPQFLREIENHFFEKSGVGSISVYLKSGFELKSFLIEYNKGDTEDTKRIFTKTRAINLS